jgi:hypothetical protein
MKSTPKVTDGLAGAGPGVAAGICTRPVTALAGGISGTRAVNTSDKRGLIVFCAVAFMPVHETAHRADRIGVCIVPVVARLDRGVTNASNETSMSSLHDSKLF